MTLPRAFRATKVQVPGIIDGKNVNNIIFSLSNN